MRILMVAARCYPLMGGIETHIQESRAPQAWSRCGHAVRCAHHRSLGKLPVEEEVRGMRVKRVPALAEGPGPSMWRPAFIPRSGAGLGI